MRGVVRERVLPQLPVGFLFLSQLSRFIELVVVQRLGQRRHVSAGFVHRVKDRLGRHTFVLADGPGSNGTACVASTLLTRATCIETLTLRGTTGTALLPQQLAVPAWTARARGPSASARPPCTASPHSRDERHMRVQRAVHQRPHHHLGVDVLLGLRPGDADALQRDLVELALGDDAHGGEHVALGTWWDKSKKVFVFVDHCTCYNLVTSLSILQILVKARDVTRNNVTRNNHLFAF